MSDDLAKEVLAELRALRKDVAAMANLGRLVSRQEAAALLGIHPRTFDRLRVRGTVPPGRRVGRQWRWKAEELLAV